MTLLIDTASAVRTLSESELRAWAEGRSVFISSVMDELAAERRAVAAIAEELGMHAVLFEDLGGRDESAETAYLAGVAQAEIYIGLIGARYGTMQPSGRSPTHEEYLQACGLGRRISVWSREPCAERQGNARDFLAEVQTFHTTGRFSDADNLETGLRRRLGEIAADDEAPWVKLGEAIFRASRIRDSGDHVHLTAAVRDAALARYLEGLRPDQWRHRGELKLCTADRAGVAEVHTVTSETEARSSRTLEIELQVNWSDGSGGQMAVGVQGYSADDLVAVGLESGLLRTPVPPNLDAVSWGGVLDVSDPLQPLLSQQLPEDAIGSVARLLIVERLLGTEGASHIDSFNLGPENRGNRRLSLTYTDARRYTNEEPGTRVIEGVRPW